MENKNTFKAKFKKLMLNTKFRNFLNSLYSFGASVVVLGALFKIQHWNGAGFMLTAGLITEALIFFIYAFEPGEEEHVENEEVHLSSKSTIFAGTTVLSHGDQPGAGLTSLVKFDQMLLDANISPDVFVNLGEGMKKLGESTVSLNAMVDVTAASVSYLKTIKHADESLAKTAKTYENVISDVVTKTVFKYKGISHALANLESGSGEFRIQMKNMTQNAGALNEVFQNQKKIADEYLKEQIICAKETQIYREQMVELNKNLIALNKIYSNMVTAMHIRK